ncbi:MAG: hypothetical protein G01um101417_183 [Parcubacteria group bacterium Gr01-1014_17]|nr:MAG: hypothetical protein G01um101417_183 [Parcubacteria group bacterium Gr01-1014_17]
MKKTHSIVFIVAIITIALLMIVMRVGYVRGKNAGLTAMRATTQTNQPPVVAKVAVPTNAPSQIDLLAAEVKALKAANEEREAMVNRLFKLNEEVQRERATNTVIVPVTVNVTNSQPSVVIQGTLNVGNPLAPQSVPTKKAATPKGRVPMYVITNSTSSVKVSGTNTVSETNTSVQNFLHPGRRSLLGVIMGGRSNPIPTDTPSGESVQQGRPPTPVIVVQQPYGYGYQYGYGGGYGYGYPYQRAPVYNQSCERRLFGVRFHSR